MEANSEAAKSHFKKANVSCTAMLVDNLADATWISVPCSKTLIRTIFCLIENKTSDSSDGNIQLAQDFSCNKGEIIKDAKCYLFWGPNDSKGQEEQESSRSQCKKITQLSINLTTIKAFEDVFHSIGTDSFPPFEMCRSNIQIVVFKHFHLLEYKLISAVDQGIVVHKFKLGMHTAGVNVLKCEDFYTSSKFVCSGKVDRCLVDIKNELPTIAKH